MQTEESRKKPKDREQLMQDREAGTAVQTERREQQYREAGKT